MTLIALEKDKVRPNLVSLNDTRGDSDNDSKAKSHCLPLRVSHAVNQSLHTFTAFVLVAVSVFNQYNQISTLNHFIITNGAFF